VVVFLPFQSGIKLFKRCCHRIARGLQFGESILDRLKSMGFCLKGMEMRQLGYPERTYHTEELLFGRKHRFDGQKSPPLPGKLKIIRDSSIKETKISELDRSVERC